MKRFMGSKKLNSKQSSSSIGSSCGFEELSTNNVLEDNDNITNSILFEFNHPQDREGNYIRLTQFGGVEHIISELGIISLLLLLLLLLSLLSPSSSSDIDIKNGLEPVDVLKMRHRFGENSFPMGTLLKFYEFLFDALSDSTLIILLIAAALSIIVGTIQNPVSGHHYHYHHYPHHHHYHYHYHLHLYHHHYQATLRDSLFI